MKLRLADLESKIASNDIQLNHIKKISQKELKDWIRQRLEDLKEDNKTGVLKVISKISINKEQITTYIWLNQEQNSYDEIYEIATIDRKSFVKDKSLR